MQMQDTYMTVLLQTTRWMSDSSLRCTTSAATTFLAGQNIELPIQIKVGLSHRLGSFQVRLV